MAVAIDYPPCVSVEVPIQYYFTVTAANAAVGDTYTNNGITFTVIKFHHWRDDALLQCVR